MTNIGVQGYLNRCVLFFLREFVLPLSSSEESSYVRIPLFQDITFISANVRGGVHFFLLLEAGLGQSAPNPRATVSCSFKTRLTMNFSQKRCLRLLRRSSLVTSEQYSLTRRLRRRKKKKNSKSTVEHKRFTFAGCELSRVFLLRHHLWTDRVHANHLERSLLFSLGDLIPLM